ncbi:MAG: superoxide dismutase family protein [Azospirillum sp.]|nr:superoxide dismutase family protein [Azospirillum sp.]
MKVQLVALAFAATGLIGSQAFAAETAGANFINGAKEALGHATLVQGPSGVLIDLDLHGLPPGPHGIHIHSVGNCDDAPAFKASGGHLNPAKKPHGLLNAEGPDNGDLPNITVAADGTLHAQLFTTLASLSAGSPPAILDADGGAFVIHEHPDDQTAQPIGGAGGRIACGVITTTKP